MNYRQSLVNICNSFDKQAKYEVERDLGTGFNYKLIGRDGLIFSRGPFCWEFNADAVKIGGVFVKDMRAWIFSYADKVEVQRITRKAHDLTVARQNFLHNIQRTAVVRKRLYEFEGNIKVYELPEISLIFFRVRHSLTPRIINDLKILAKTRWCHFTDSWYTSNLYADELRRIFSEMERADDNFLDLAVNNGII